MRRVSLTGLLRRALPVLLFLVAIPRLASADFELPILNPVPKIVSVPNDISVETLAQFAQVRNLRLEVRMTRGNLVPDWLITFLEKRFAGITKCIVLSGTLKPIHVTQLRKLSKLEVRYLAGRSNLDRETYNSLHALGPVHKVLVLENDFEPGLLEGVKRLKYFAPVVRLRQERPDLQRLDWLVATRNRQKTFVLPQDFNPVWVYDLTVLRPLLLEVRTLKNRLDDSLLAVLRDLHQVELTVVVDGRLTLDDVRQLARLDRFSLKVEIHPTSGVIPGLVQLLNRIAPP